MDARRTNKTKRVEIHMVREYTVEEKTCPECGKEFEGPKVRVFCSDPCRRKTENRRYQTAKKQRADKEQAG